MARARPSTDEAFAEVLPRLLEERGLSLRALAAEVGVSNVYLSKGMRGKDYKRVSPEVISRIGAFFGLPAGYFPEEREALVIERIRNDEHLRDELYRRFAPRGSDQPNGR